jgi:subfamily B ATP-binding cassette protein MsbA
LKNNATSKQESSLQIYLRLLNYVKPYWKIFALSLFGYLIFAATQPMFASLMKYMVDALQAKHREAVYWIPLATVGIVLVRGIGSFLGGYFIALVANHVVHKLRCEVFNHYTRLPSNYFDSHNSGSLISPITYNIVQVTGAATSAVKIIVREGFTVIGLLGYLIYMNWMLSLIFLLIMPIIGWIVRIATVRFRQISKKMQTSMAEITQVSSEMITGNRVVRSFGGESYEQDRFCKASQYCFKQNMRMFKTQTIQSPLLQFIIACALAILIFLALLLMQDASAGDFIAYITAAGLLPKSVRQLSDINATIQKGITAAKSVFDILDEASEHDSGTQKVESVRGQLVFEQVTFKYPGTDKNILDSISFEVQPGQTVALVGQSGSGKSSLVSLISRFYDYQSGDIQLDGVSIKEYELENLRSHIALVTQQVNLFDDTIERNIAYGSLEQFSREEVIEAATKAHAMEFIEQLPDGLDTPIGENGLKLSGGQRQRLAIARALLKNAPILILDEATSALDNESEMKIQSAIDNAKENRTTLIIAHRLSTIEKADKIIVMKSGKIVEMGDHASLLQKNGYYQQLYSMNFQDTEPE